MTSPRPKKSRYELYRLTIFKVRSQPPALEVRAELTAIQRLQVEQRCKKLVTDGLIAGYVLDKGSRKRRKVLIVIQQPAEESHLRFADVVAMLHVLNR